MYMLFAIASIFILLDIVSGIVAAVSKNELSSSIMREGLYHKAAEIILMVVGLVGQYAVSYSEFSGIVPDGVFQAVILYVVAMELLSILENVNKANPNLNLDKMLHMFGQKSE